MIEAADTHNWQLEAWAVMANHYHFVGKAPDNGAENLRHFLGDLHRQTATWLNRLDNTPGRKVWHNYRESSLTFENSYYARLHYVMNNPVHHGLVPLREPISMVFSRLVRTARDSSLPEDGEIVPHRPAQYRRQFLNFGVRRAIAAFGAGESSTGKASGCGKEPVRSGFGSVGIGSQ
ncbi:MAG: hypothetical protein QM755_24305 [Luteolibacter sp.]